MGIVIKGDLAWSRNRHELKTIENGHIAIEGRSIVGVFRSLPEKYENFELLDYTGKLVIPGLYDLHTHAPQNHFKGLYMDEQLLKWLQLHTFPEESRFAERDFYTKAYDAFADEISRGATMGVCCFASIHREATLYLMQALENSSVISYVGKVNMDRNSPDYYIEKTGESIAETKRWIEEWKELGLEWSYPIVTPRFIPSVSDELACNLGKLVKEGGYPVQSHLSENLGEIDWVKELCPESSSYADAYRRRGLWGETKTIMAHCVWSKQREEELLKNSNLFIAHCPDSNANLYSGIAAAKYYLDNGFNIGLGTDVAAGTSLSLFRGITDAVKASKLRYRLCDEGDGMLTFQEAFYMASAGGGAFFGRCGSFENGYDANIVVLDEERSIIEKDLSIGDRLERYAYTTPERPTLHRIFEGKPVY